MNYRELLSKLNTLSPGQLEMECLVLNIEEDQLYVVPRLEFADEDHSTLLEGHPFFSFDALDVIIEDDKESEKDE